MITRDPKPDRTVPLPPRGSESDRSTGKRAARLASGSGESVVVLEAGDPRWTPGADSLDWDWDADAVSAEHQCVYCGATEPLFKLEDGVIACGHCVHGGTAGGK
jgi:hypothetical protein